MGWIYPYLSAWVTPTTVNDLFQALITPRRDPTRRGSASQPELRRETRPGSWLSRIQSGKSWLSPWNLVGIMQFMNVQFIKHILYTLYYCMYSLIDWFFLRSASPPAPPKSRMKVTSALPSAKLVPQNNGCLENPKWCLTHGSEIWPTSILRFQSRPIHHHHLSSR